MKYLLIACTFLVTLNAHAYTDLPPLPSNYQMAQTQRYIPSAQEIEESHDMTQQYYAENNLQHASRTDEMPMVRERPVMRSSAYEAMRAQQNHTPYAPARVLERHALGGELISEVYEVFPDFNCVAVKNYRTNQVITADCYSINVARR